MQLFLTVFPEYREHLCDKEQGGQELDDNLPSESPRLKLAASLNVSETPTRVNAPVEEVATPTLESLGLSKSTLALFGKSICVIYLNFL
jgi:hypothetical protein